MTGSLSSWIGLIHALDSHRVFAGLDSCDFFNLFPWEFIIIALFQDLHHQTPSSLHTQTGQYPRIRLDLIALFIAPLLSTPPPF